MDFIIECNTLVAGMVGFFLQGKMSVKRASWTLSAKLYSEFTEIIVSPHLNPPKISKSKVCLDFIDEGCFHVRTGGGGRETLTELIPQSLLERTVSPHPDSADLQYSFPLSFFSLDSLIADLSSTH